MAITEFFQVLDSELVHLDGHHKINSSATEACMKPGCAVKFTSGELIETDDGDTPCGLLYGLHGEAYDYMRNDSKTKYTNFKTGDYVTIVYGGFVAQVSADRFTSGSLPSVGNAIYAAVSGLLATSSSSGPQIGQVTALDPVSQADGATANVARIRFEIPGF